MAAYRNSSWRKPKVVVASLNPENQPTLVNVCIVINESSMDANLGAAVEGSTAHSVQQLFPLQVSVAAAILNFSSRAILGNVDSVIILFKSGMAENVGAKVNIVAPSLTV